MSHPVAGNNPSTKHLCCGIIYNSPDWKTYGIQLVMAITSPAMMYTEGLLCNTVNFLSSRLSLVKTFACMQMHHIRYKVPVTQMCSAAKSYTESNSHHGK